MGSNSYYLILIPLSLLFILRVRFAGQVSLLFHLTIQSRESAFSMFTCTCWVKQNCQSRLQRIAWNSRWDPWAWARVMLKTLEHQKQHGSKEQWFWEHKSSLLIFRKRKEKGYRIKRKKKNRRGGPGRGGENPKWTIQANYWTTKYLFLCQRLLQVFITRTGEKNK